MRVEANEQRGVTVVSVLDARIDATSSDEFKLAVASSIDRGPMHIVLDLTSVSFIDSTGLGALVGGFKHISSKGGRLIVVGLQPGVSSLFKLTRMDKLFEVRATPTEAIDQLSRRA
ncbi:MAG TPA: STAS domain-containing protein [Polyangiaceae bacterium]